MDTTLFNMLAQVKEQSLWFPVDATTSNQVDGLAYFILWVCGFFLVFNAGLMVYFAIRYRQQKKAGAATGQTHNTALEVTWSVIPAFILAIIFIWGFRSFLVQETPPDDAYDIMVTGKKWVWSFSYPDGGQSKSEKDPETGKDRAPALHVPAGRPVRLTLQSNDVLHSVFIPELRVKKDCVPGRFNQMWFEAKFDEKNAEDWDLPTEDGGTVTVRRNEYDLFCTEYCGQDHSMMITKVYVYQPEDFEKWYVSKSLYANDTPLAEIGQTIWTTQCKSCHSIDGSGTGTYPSWQNLFGAKNHATTPESTAEVDAAYIYDSIRNPASKLAPNPNGGNYPNGMAAFPNLTDREIRGIIAYMKTISDKAKPEDLTYGDLNVDGTVKGETDGDTEEDADAAGDGGDAETEPVDPAQ